MAQLLGGELSSHPTAVQPEYDLVTPAGERAQVWYLANPAARWINEHHIHFGHADCDAYALVFFEDLLPLAMILFLRSDIGKVCAALGKRHPNQESGLQRTRRNFLQMLDEENAFSSLGVRMLRLDAVPEH